MEEVDRFVIDPGPLKWMIPLLNDAGPVVAEHTMNGTRFRGLNWLELQAWATMTGEEVDSDTLRAIRTMSGAYAAQVNASQVMECPAPYDPPKDDPDAAL